MTAEKERMSSSSLHLMTTAECTVITVIFFAPPRGEGLMHVNGEHQASCIDVIRFSLRSCTGPYMWKTQHSRTTPTKKWKSASWLTGLY